MKFSWGGPNGITMLKQYVDNLSKARVVKIVSDQILTLQPP